MTAYVDLLAKIQMTTIKKWRFWIDRGGTFTDIVALSPDNILHTKKLLSENPESYDDAALEGMSQFLGVDQNAPMPSHKIHSVKMGTTVATNALLERKGERIALAISAGLRDALEIGYQARDDIFALNIKKQNPLYQTVIEIDERLDACGGTITPLDEAEIHKQLSALYADGYRALAIVFMHAYLNPQHEIQCAKIARNIGFTQISTSSQASPLIKLISRGDTAVVDAYLSPILKRYVDKITQALGREDQGGPQLLFMQSSGGLTRADFFHGRNAVLSGPAGGVIGAVRTAKQAGFSKIIGFDMGGTSTDVCHYAGEYERSFETKVAGIRMRAPMLEIHTVAAGGGSVLSFDGERYRVGPKSAGANPGPACYRRGGPLSVTDINAALGKLNPDTFPAIFGKNQDLPLDANISAQGLKAIGEQSGKTIEETAEGFLSIAVDHMARAIKKISIERGYDLDGYTLACFGGAGGQHACLVAEQLGISSILIHPLAGVLSAFGMGLADLSTLNQKTINLPVSKIQIANAEADILSKRGHAHLHTQGIAPEDISEKRIAYVRYSGSDTSLPIPLSPLGPSLKTDFENAHRARFSFIDENADIIIESISVETYGGRETLENLTFAKDTAHPPLDTKFYAKGKWREAKLYQRAALTIGDIINGPALILDASGTNVIEPDWQAVLTAEQNLHLTKTATTHEHKTITARDPVRLEIFNNLFMSIAEQMGAVLQNTASSVNIKERLDFSCAIFDQDGGLVANAPHMPVHIGSMDASIRALMNSGLTMRKGDSFVHNNPYDGGTHLPDINVITPVFDPNPNAKPDTILFYIASRGHHADIGGIAPGSMSPLAVNIMQEGVVIDCMHLVSGGELLEDKITNILSSGPYPARNPRQNIADLKSPNRRQYNGRQRAFSPKPNLRSRHGTSLYGLLPRQWRRQCAPRHKRPARLRIYLPS